MGIRTRAAPLVASGCVSIGLALLLTQCGPGRFDGLASYGDAAAADADASPPERLPPPRQLSPTSTSFVTTLANTFTWKLPPGVTEARFEMCDSTACGAPTQTVDVVGESVKLPAPSLPVTDFEPAFSAWRVRSRAGTEVGRPSPVWGLNTFLGASLGDTFWNGPPDLDGDFVPEFIVGSPNEGRVYLYKMGATILDDACSIPRFPISQVLERKGTSFGAVVRFGGDVDGDGLGDLIVAAPAIGADLGHVYVVPGARAPAMLRNEAAYDLTSGTIGTFGQTIDGGGDIDGDGYNDVLVGDLDHIFVFWGGPSGPGSASRIDSAAPGFGCALAGIGDINGDRYADFAVAAGCEDAGRVFVYRGGPTRTFSPARELAHPPGAMTFGKTLVHAGDVDGDGKSDLLVGAPKSGAFYIYGQREIDQNGLSTVPATTVAEPDFGAFGARGGEGREGGRWTNRGLIASRGNETVTGKLFPISFGAFSAVALPTSDDALITDVSLLSAGIITIGLRLRNGSGRVVVRATCETKIRWIEFEGEGNPSFGRSIAK